MFTFLDMALFSNNNDFLTHHLCERRAATSCLPVLFVSKENLILHMRLEVAEDTAGREEGRTKDPS